MMARDLAIDEQPRVDRDRPLLLLDKLSVELEVGGARQPILKEVSLELPRGGALGLVGESGSGKSMTTRAIARLLPPGGAASGGLFFDGKEVLTLEGPQLRSHRSEVATIFQDPRAHINPVRRIGDFMTETLRLMSGQSREEAQDAAVKVLREVGIPDGERRLNQFPHELSGGLLQRVMIGAALLSEPLLILADEPTTALDVTTQAEVMALLSKLRRERGVAILFVTHDLDLAAAVCDRVAVMYAGRIVETGSATRMEKQGLHPYATLLAAARPDVERRLQRLAAIPGRPVSAFEASEACAFAPRCHLAQERCQTKPTPLVEMDGGEALCWRPGESRHLPQPAAS